MLQVKVNFDIVITIRLHDFGAVNCISRSRSAIASVNVGDTIYVTRSASRHVKCDYRDITRIVQNSFSGFRLF